MQEHDGTGQAPATRPHPADLPRPFRAGFLERPHARLAELGRDRPVVAVVTPAGRRAYVVTSDAAVRVGLLDPRLSLRRPVEPRVARPPRDENLMNYAPAQHARIRRLAASALSERRVAGYRPLVEAAAADLLGGLPDDRPVDLLHEFSRPYAFRCVCDVLGVDPAARADLYATARDIFAAAMSRTDPPTLDRVHAVMEREILVRQEAATQQIDVLARIAAMARRADPTSLDELVSLATMLLLAGLESTAQMICMCVIELLARPELRARLAGDPAVLPAAVEEMLRLTTPGPFATTRYPTEDVTLDGCPVPSGEPVLLSLVAANRDPAVYPHPDEIDLNRDPRDRHLTFGWGAHFCPGAALARLELVVGLGALLDRFPGMNLVSGPAEIRWQGSYRNRGVAELRLWPRPR